MPRAVPPILGLWGLSLLIAAVVVGLLTSRGEWASGA
jgi:hypothetical protein